MSKAQQIRALMAEQKFRSPASIARKLGCPEIYVLRCAFKPTYQSVKAGQRSALHRARRRRAA